MTAKQETITIDMIPATDCFPASLPLFDQTLGYQEFFAAQKTFLVGLGEGLLNAFFVCLCNVYCDTDRDLPDRDRG